MEQNGPNRWDRTRFSWRRGRGGCWSRWEEREARVRQRGRDEDDIAGLPAVWGASESHPRPGSEWARLHQKGLGGKGPRRQKKKRLIVNKSNKSNPKIIIIHGKAAKKKTPQPKAKSQSSTEKETSGLTTSPSLTGDGSDADLQIRGPPAPGQSILPRNEAAIVHEPVGRGEADG